MEVTTKTVEQMRADVSAGLSQNQVAKKYNKLGYVGGYGAKLSAARVWQLINKPTKTKKTRRPTVRKNTTTNGA